MSLMPLDIPPGIVKTRSPNAAQGRYLDSDKMRFVNGKPEKWKGWTKLITSVLIGMARGIVSWANSFGVQNIAIGTHLKLYAVKSGDLLTDITPLRSNGTLGNNPFATTSGSANVTVTHTNHGADAGAFVTFSGATAVAGITINGEYQIVSITDPDHYVITHSSSANATTTGGGASVTFAYQINPGNAGGLVGLGWGAGPWGAGTWGTPRSSGGIVIEMRHWSLANYGNDLMALPSLGTLYLWHEATDPRAVKVTNAPASARAMFVTGERFPMLLGTTTPMTVQWPDRDDITDWTPTAANTANERKLQNGSKLIAGTSLTDLVNLIWSDTSLYVFQYTGSEFVYDDRLAGSRCGLIGPQAFVVVDGVAYWMSGNSFHTYSGSVQIIQNAEDIRAFVFSHLNGDNTIKTWCLYDQANKQIRWHYCSSESTEPNRYVDVSLIDFSWTVGTFDGTSGTVYRPDEGLPVTVDFSGKVYLHGIGNDADAAAMAAYITYGLYALSRGELNADVFEFVPDFERHEGPVTIELYGKERPDSVGNLDTVTITIDPGEEIEDIRLQARHFSFTVRSNVIGGDFRLGTPMLDARPAGAR